MRASLVLPLQLPGGQASGPGGGRSREHCSAAPPRECHRPAYCAVCCWKKTVVCVNEGMFEEGCEGRKKASLKRRYKQESLAKEEGDEEQEPVGGHDNHANASTVPTALMPAFSSASYLLTHLSSTGKPGFPFTTAHSKETRGLSQGHPQGHMGACEPYCPPYPPSHRLQSPRVAWPKSWAQPETSFPHIGIQREEPILSHEGYNIFRGF